ncbi:uncharacterized protein LOC9630386 [Selaginella moellendorffii]|uniref:uncharacterized protein LOC9630386 n=1 Tax=Selaginella moellendorffii TaxID=88036 RepID=UPI000D1CDB2F|nr:uncharacterized protein LOC9630386 [Selaginella moellendorffii]|eukprot:XP_024536448.1 uncharacterized protein LOC9630386 [Selaginella moellendorffii]
MQWCPWRCFEFLRDLLPGERFQSGAMGGASSTLTDEQKELQNLRSHLGRDFELLASAFSRLTKSEGPNAIHESKLERCFGMEVGRIKDLPGEESSDLKSLLENFGSTLTAVAFKPVEGYVSWPGFLKGYDGCCQQNLVSTRLRFLLLFVRSLKSQGKKSSSETSSDLDENLEGQVSSREFRDVLWLCWLMTFYKRLSNGIELPVVEPLVRGAFQDSEKVPLKDLYSWMLATIPSLGNVFVDYVQYCLFQDEDTEVKSGLSHLPGHLTPGRLWSLALALKDKTGDTLLSACLEDSITLLYRSPVHGKGMNRLWSQVEGYREAVLFLFSGMSAEDPSKTWLLAAVIPSGLENKSNFYGTSNSCLICLDPEFIVLHPTGKEKNYVYSHKTAPGGGYNSRPMPNGIGFGGSMENERIWISDDFSTVTLRHHAVDKTYQAGFILPYQGYAPLCCQVLEVEVWGLGSKTAQERMATFQQREKLFAEQRRKVDLKAFGNWQDSPEKMMMDMVSNPNRPQREER